MLPAPPRPAPPPPPARPAARVTSAPALRYMAERGDVQRALGQPDRRAEQGDEARPGRSVRPGHAAWAPGRTGPTARPPSPRRRDRASPHRPAAAAGCRPPEVSPPPAPWPRRPPAAPRCPRRLRALAPAANPPPAWPAPARPAAQSPRYAAGGRPPPRTRPRRPQHPDHGREVGIDEAAVPAEPDEYLPGLSAGVQHRADPAGRRPGTAPAGTTPIARPEQGTTLQPPDASRLQPPLAAW